MNRPRVNKEVAQLVGLLVLQLALVVPFLGQPIHMDDSIYLDIGRNVLNKPLQPHDFPYCFEGYCAPDMASHSHPPFVGYWIGLLVWVFGEGPRLPVMLHLGFLVFPLLFAASTYLLARRFTVRPLMASALAVVSPAAVVMSHNLMADFPSLAFWTAAMACYVRGVDREENRWLGGAALFLSLSAFCSYPALLAAPLCWWYARLKRCRLRLAWWVPAVPCAWMGFWLSWSSLYFGRFVLSGTTRYFVQAKGSLGVSGIVEKLISIPILLAGTLTPVLLLAGKGAGWMKGRGAVLWAMACAASTQAWAGSYGFPEKLLFFALLLSGGGAVFGLLGLFRTHREHGDSLFLWGWLGAVSVIPVLVYSAASPRYLLPLLPPMILLACGEKGTGRNLLGKGLLIFSLALACTLSAADYEMARVHQSVGRELGVSFRGWESRTRFGGEWGFRHYMLDQGFRQFLSTSNDMGGGQIVVLPRQAVPYTLPQDVESMLIPLGMRSWSSALPVRLMNREAHAGFYSSGWGLLPFAFSNAPVEEITIGQVSQLVEGLPEISIDGGGNEAAIPVPAPGGGVDLRVPLPSRLRIPYEGPSPVRFEFQLILPKSSPVIPKNLPAGMKAVFDQEGSRKELPMTVRALPDSRPQESAFSVRLQIDGSPGAIFLELGEADRARDGGTVLLRRAVFLPPGWNP